MIEVNCELHSNFEHINVAFVSKFNNVGRLLFYLNSQHVVSVSYFGWMGNWAVNSCPFALFHSVIVN